MKKKIIGLISIVFFVVSILVNENILIASSTTRNQEISAKEETLQKTTVINRENVLKENKGTSDKAETSSFTISLDTKTSYEVTNTISQTLTIKRKSDYLNDYRYEYIEYDEEGNIVNSGNNRYEDLEISPNKKVRISATNEKCELYIPNELMKSTKKVDSPTFQQLYIEKGETYEFVNKNNNGKELRFKNDWGWRTGLIYSIIYYNKYNDVEKMEYSSVGDIVIGEGKKVKLTVESGAEPMLVHIPYEFKDCYKKVSIPNFTSFIAEKGETYEFTNEFCDNIEIIPTSSGEKCSYDYISYDEYGDIRHMGYNEDRSIYVSKYDKTKVTFESKAIIHVPYEFKDSYKKVSTPTFEKINLTSDSSYLITNYDKEKIEILSSTKLGGDETLDYIYYNESGGEYYFRQQYDNYKIYKNQKMKVSLGSGKSATLYLPYEFRDKYKKIQTPIFFKETVTSEKAYEIKNSTNSKISIFNDAFQSGAKFNIVTYKDEVKVWDYEKCEFNSISLNPGERAVINVLGRKSINFYVPYELKMPQSADKIEDINGDGKVDILDLEAVADCYGFNDISNEFKERCDLTGDKIIDIYDIVSVARKIK
ncbi:hypothetical protein SAMN02745163_03152 [Clostridium cavendishii DSM 21758]|uniref:Dockerin domain-containing protein n=1 Tax=Clostridium cavendishii DSM 21758 TaxID=1121302 RepID=A0A1M6PGQ4_9CLOT|nr:dockerin type I domain-containing protein [Clostridium cavendishii]SHK07135.1 hypothetical protein SAMN02745163_03152 [Clostridium cavendishii DSM 21758]